MAGGQLVEWTQDRAVARGLDNIAYGEVVSIDGAGQAIVCGLRDGAIDLAPLTTRTPVQNAGVRRIGPHVIPAGTMLVGRTLDVTGEPIDARGPLRCDTLHRVFGRDPYTLAPSALGTRRMTTGLLVFDLQLRMSLGTSLWVVGDREVAYHVMAHQHAANRICVVATPRVTRRAYQSSRRPELPCIQVAPSEDASPMHQWLVPWTALAIADGLRAQGHDVVVLLDDLDRWRRHIPVGLPRGSWATQLAQLGARAYAAERGSVSIFGRIEGEVTPAVAAGFHTGIDLDLALLGHPYRRDSKLVMPPIKVPRPQLLARSLIDAAQLAELERTKPWLRAHPKLDLSTRTLISGGQKAREVLRYRNGMTLDCLEQLACALAAQHVLDLQAEAVGAFVEAFLPALRKEHGARLDAIREGGVLGEDDQKAILALAVMVAAPFLLS
jgi:F0F1-type ATP synthase alpha subunit